VPTKPLAAIPKKFAFGLAHLVAPLRLGRKFADGVGNPPPAEAKGGKSDLIDELLEELEMPNRQIQLTAVYIKKLTGVLREL